MNGPAELTGAEIMSGRRSRIWDVLKFPTDVTEMGLRQLALLRMPHVQDTSTTYYEGHLGIP